jgi:hypothetical protein
MRDRMFEFMKAAAQGDNSLRECIESAAKLNAMADGLSDIFKRIAEQRDNWHEVSRQRDGARHSAHAVGRAPRSSSCEP